VKVAIIHYWFITRRGGEKVVESILKLYPQADIYTLFYDEKKYGDYLNGHNVYTSKFNNKFFRKYYQRLFPLYPLVVNSLKLKKNYDLIISSESGPVKGVRIKNNARHVCYIHSPMRYCWGFTNEYLQSMNSMLRPLAKYLLGKLKEYDKTTINNVDFYISNSENVSKRVKKYYSRISEIVYPPIENRLFDHNFNSKKNKDFFLSFGAITPYKKIDLLVDYFNKSGEKLIIIGNGSEKEKLEEKANENIDFKGFLEDAELISIIQNSKALIFPGEEDFGMIPLEVMALGIPVIAFQKGGALETVVENKTDPTKSSGIFFKEQNVISLQNAINYFHEIESEFDPMWIREHARNFEESKFLQNFKIKMNNFLG
jgi:glycosyltransferase involved in cell wall biosynthesis